MSNEISSAEQTANLLNQVAANLPFADLQAVNSHLTESRDTFQVATTGSVAPEAAATVGLYANMLDQLDDVSGKIRAAQALILHASAVICPVIEPVPAPASTNVTAQPEKCPYPGAQTKTVKPEVTAESNALVPEPELPTNRRPKPEGFDSLQDQTKAICPEDFVHDCTPFPRELAEAASTIISTLDNETLERTRYYALGESMRLLDHTLDMPHDMANPTGPTKLDYVVEKAAEQLAEKFLTTHNPRDKGLTIHELDSLNMSNEAMAVSRQAAAMLPTDLHLLADALTMETRGRRQAQNHTDLSLVVPGTMARSVIISGIAEGDKVANAMGEDVFSGASLLYQAALTTRSGPNAYNGLPIRDIVSDEELRNLVPLKVANSAAALVRLDKIPGIKDMVSLNESGILQFDRSKATNESAQRSGLQIMHTDVLGCPAVQVEGLMAKVAGRYPDIVIRAQQIIAES